MGRGSASSGAAVLYGRSAKRRVDWAHRQELLISAINDEGLEVAFPMASQWLAAAPESARRQMIDALIDADFKRRWPDSDRRQMVAEEIDYIRSCLRKQVAEMLGDNADYQQLQDFDPRVWLWHNPNPPGRMSDNLIGASRVLLDTLSYIPEQHRAWINEHPEIWEMPLMETVLRTRFDPQPGHLGYQLDKIGLKPSPPLVDALVNTRAERQVVDAEKKARRLALEMHLHPYTSPILRSDKRTNKVIHYLPDPNASKTACGVPLSKTATARRGDWKRAVSPEIRDLHLRACKRCLAKGQPPVTDYEIDEFPVWRSSAKQRLQQVLAKQIRSEAMSPIPSSTDNAAELAEQRENELAAKLADIKRSYTINWAIGEYNQLPETDRKTFLRLPLFSLSSAALRSVNPAKVDQLAVRRLLTFIYGSEILWKVRDEQVRLTIQELVRCDAIDLAEINEAQLDKLLEPVE